MNKTSILYLLLIVAIEILSVTSLKHWSLHHNNIFLILGLVGYLIVGSTFAFLLKTHSEMTIINTFWQILNIIFVSIVGVLVYKEQLNVYQYIGVGLAIISTVFLSIS
jgi:multidrug transporter EmrE-like cation transporter